MRIPGIKSVRRYMTWTKSRLFNGALILGYHRVALKERDQYSICVSPEYFSQQLEVLKQYSQPISLPELVNAVMDGHLPKRAVVVTFDDGYADTLYQAKPMLESFKIPATVFVTTGFIGGEFWWDELERTLFGPPTLPEKLILSINGRTYEREIGKIKNSPTKGNLSGREALLKSLYQWLLPMSSDDRQKAMVQLSAWAGWEGVENPSSRALTADEIVELTRGELIDIGSHTVTHPLLAKLPRKTQSNEIQQSKTYLEELLGQQVNSFSYPNGSSSQETETIVKASGYNCACASYNDVVVQSSNLFYLPRFWISNWDGATFRRWLRHWLSP